MNCEASPHGSCFMLNVMFTFFLICMSGVWAVWQSVDASLNSPHALVQFIAYQHVTLIYLLLCMLSDCVLMMCIFCHIAAI